MSLAVAEFFAGIGLMGAGLEPSGFEVVYANDIDEAKQAIFAANFDESIFDLGDVRDVKGVDVPDIDLATASFPCTDLSLAGERRGMERRDGVRRHRESSMFWEFARVLREMGRRRPRATLLENVPGFATSRGGSDLRAVLAELNDLGYACDVFVLDARWFLPQSRLRMFIVGMRETQGSPAKWVTTRIRPDWLCRNVMRRRGLSLVSRDLPSPPTSKRTLSSIAQRLGPANDAWWSNAEVRDVRRSMSSLQLRRLRSLESSPRRTWTSAYRRMRDGLATWELRPDAISGCLRSYKGGSSRQAIVEAGGGQNTKMRWMTPRECARLMGVPQLNLAGATPAEAYYGLGDAVCVPVIRWIGDAYLRPLLGGP